MAIQSLRRFEKEAMLVSSTESLSFESKHSTAEESEMALNRGGLAEVYWLRRHTARPLEKRDCPREVVGGIIHKTQFPQRILLHVFAHYLCTVAVAFCQLLLLVDFAALPGAILDAQSLSPVVKTCYGCKVKVWSRRVWLSIV
jgi:hypothetical protein